MWIPAALGLVGSLLGGCSGADRVIPLEIRALPPAVQAAPSERDTLGFAVAPLRDARPEGSRLGSHTQLWVTKAYFNIEGGEIGDIAAQVFIDHLKHEKGWRAWLAKPGVAPPEGRPYVTLTGSLLECAVEVRGWLAITTMTVRTKLAFELSGAGREKPIDLTVKGEKSEWTFGFDRHGVETLLNKALLESLQEFLADARMKELNRQAREGA
ncbi:MAG: hypothetical protein AB1411_13175 [Nitrospirota bacterium]